MSTQANSAESRPSQLRYRPDIDGLRAVAIVLVVGFHVGLGGFGDGFVGVDVFYVISGYLITGLLVRDIEEFGRIRFRAFYARRVRRILPALALVVLTTIAVGAFILVPWQLRDLGKSAVATAVFCSNIYFWQVLQGYFAQTAGDEPLLHTWTLAVEEQFYFIWPAFLAIIAWAALRFRFSRARSLMACVAGVSALSFVAAIWGVHHRPQAAFFLMPTRLWELGVGAMLALWTFGGGRLTRPVVGSVCAVVGMAAILGTDLFLGSTHPFPGVAAVPLVFGTAAVIAAGEAGSRLGPVNWILARRPIVLVGKVSYSWYLWHWPLLVLVRISRPAPNTGRDTLIALGSLGLAIGTYVLVEQPIRTRKVAGFRSASTSLVAGLGLVVVMIATAAWAIRTPKTALDAVRSFDYGCMVMSHGDANELPDACIPVSTGTKALVLVGDSHAAALQPAMEYAAKKLGYRLEVGTRVGCYFVKNDLPPDCSRFVDTTLSYLTAHASEIEGVVIQYATPQVGPASPFWQSQDAHMPAKWREAWASANRAVLNTLSKAGIKTLLVLQVPEFPEDVPTCLAQHPAIQCDISRKSALAYRAQIDLAEHAAVQGNPLTSVWDPFRFLCGQARCDVEKDGVVLYRDTNHLSRLGSLALAPFLTKAIRSSFVSKDRG